MDVRRLSVIDMHGASGSARRRRLIRIEFVCGALVGTLLGLWLTARASSAAGWLLAIWILGIGINYVPLAAYAVALGAADRLEAELSGVDTARELRRYGLLQLWIVVPFSLVFFTARHRAGA